MKMLIVYNPVSGGNDKDQLLTTFINMAKKDKHTVSVYKTTGKNDEKKLSNKICQFVPDRIVAKGGDGTIQLACKAILSAKVEIPIGIIPTGSANGLATSLNLPVNLEENMRLVISSSQTKYVDVLTINDAYLCIHLFDIGINALLVKHYAEDESRGMLGYAKHLMEAINNSPLLTFLIQVNNDSYHKTGYMLAGANGTKYGTGVAISEGSIDDGIFEISILSQINLGKIIKSGLTILNIFTQEHMFSDSLQCQSAVVEISPPAPLQIDGEYMGEVDQVAIRINPSAIKIIVPDEA